jgi:hypothetical protein
MISATLGSVNSLLRCFCGTGIGFEADWTGGNDGSSNSGVSTSSSLDVSVDEADIGLGGANSGTAR